MLSTPKWLGLLAVAFVAGTFIASPEFRAFAANTIGSADIINNTIQSADLKDGEVKTADLGSDSITSTKVKDGEIKSADIANAAVQTTDIGSNAINSAKIKDGEVMTDDIANDAVTSDKLADGVFDSMQNQIDALTAENAALEARVDALESGSDGTPDENEPNDTHSTATDLGDVNDSGTTRSENATFHAASDDHDWYKFRAVEVTSTSCFPGNDEDYRTTINVSGIPAGSDYDLDVYFNTVGGTPFSSTNTSNVDEEVQVDWTGECASADTANFIVDVSNVGATGSTLEYKLTVTHEFVA